MRIKLSIAVISLLVTASCTNPFGSSQEGTTLQTDRDSYTVGETVTLTLTNWGPGEIAVNGTLNCLLAVHERFRPVGNGLKRVCSTGKPRLKKGRSMSTEIRINADAFPPGKNLRFKTEARRGAGWIAIRSNEFFVAALN